MKKALLIVCLSFAISALSFAVVLAEESKPAAQKEAAPAMSKKEKAEYAKKVALFIELATYGEKQKDPLALISSVKLLDELPFGGIVKPGEADKGGARYERDALLSQAKQFAAEDQELLAVIAKVQTPPEKVAVRGHHDHDRYYRGYYYERRHHERRYSCDWYFKCRHGNCNWVCR